MVIIKAYFQSSQALMFCTGPEPNVRMEINFLCSVMTSDQGWNILLLIVWKKKTTFYMEMTCSLGRCNWTFTICLFFLEHTGSSYRLFLSQQRHSNALSCLFCLENSGTQDNDDNNSNILTPKSPGKIVTSCLEIVGQWQNGKFTMTQTRQGCS